MFCKKLHSNNLTNIVLFESSVFLPLYSLLFLIVVAHFYIAKYQPATITSTAPARSNIC